MPITCNWNQKSKAFIKNLFEDPWTVEEFIEARKTWYRMIKSVTHCVPILLDLRETHETPKEALRHFTALHRTPHPRQGHIYILGMNETCARLADHFCVGSMDPDKSIRVVESVDEIVSP